MATFEVNTLVDEADYGATTYVSGIGFIPIGPLTSLREAIKLANDSMGADTITFADELSGTIRLTQGTEITISDEVTIIGGDDITITGDANGDDLGADGTPASTSGGITDVAKSLEGADLLDDNSRIFFVSADSGEVRLNGLTLTGGRVVGDNSFSTNFDNDGGAVLVNSSNVDLFITSSTIAGNSTVSELFSRGGGVYSSGDIFIEQSSFLDNVAATSNNNAGGGAVYSISSITITDSLFDGNSAGTSGGAVRGVIVTATNSTFTGNSLTNSTFGAGAAIRGTDGTSAADSDTPAVTVINSTITGNVIASDNSNYYDDATAIHGGGDVVIQNSIVLGNAAPNSDETFEVVSREGGEGGFLAPITFEGFNIVGTDEGAFFNDQIDGGGSHINASAASVFAQTEDNNGAAAGVLGANGGDVQTIALKAIGFNPALDAAGAGATAADARGETAVDQPTTGGPRDLGAFELTEVVEASSLVVTTTDDVVDATDGETSLREAVEYANFKEGEDTITFAPSGQGVIQLSKDLVVTDDLIIQGGGVVTISGDADGDDDTLEGYITDLATSTADQLDDNSLIFSTLSSKITDITVDGLTLTGGRNVNESIDGGGAIYASGDVTILNSTLTGNSTERDESSGGAVFAGGALTITNSTISGNSTAGFLAFGGGAHSEGALTITNSTISGNSTSGDKASGGGLSSVGALVVTNSSISNNSATGLEAGGAGVHSDDAVTLVGSTISGNTSTGEFSYGGGVLADNGLTATNSTIAGNSVGEDGSGGAARINSGAVTITITNSTITGNSAGENGVGGLVVYSFDDVTVTNSIVLGNNNQGGSEIFDLTSGNGLITVTGANIIGADSDGFDVSTQVDSASTGTVQNAAAATVFNQTRDNNGVAAGVLDDNGAPIQTIALRDGLDNPALDAATIAGLDARGEARGVDLVGVANGGTSDLGAFELQIAEDFTSPVITSPLAIFLAEGASAGLSFFPVEATDLTAVSFEILGGPDSDKVSINATTGVLSLSAEPDFENPSDANGDKTFEVRVGAKDESGGVSFGNLTITITDVNEAPVITNDAAFTAAENQTAIGTVVATDPEETAVTFALTGGTDQALFSINAATGALSFKSAPDFEAPGDAGGDNVHELQITATDAGDLTAVQSVTLTVTDVNEAPVAIASSAAGDEDTVISGALAASDVDGDSLIFTVVEGPSNGAVTIAPNGSFQFTPVADFNGTDSFTFQASDGTLSDTATATITVNPVDEPVDPVDPIDPVDPVDPVDPPAPVGPTADDDTLRGTTLNDTINALAGNDIVLGLAGDDLLIGGLGNDSLKGAAGDDTLRGNGGDDTVKGGGGVDDLKGNGGEDFIRGNGGADFIRAGGGADNVNGGGGADLIFGGGGADLLNGGGGADTIRGNGGDDTLRGNGGQDVFQFRAADRNDTIADFRQGQDRIEIMNGTNNFEALRIEQDGADVLIGFGAAGQVRVLTDNAGAFDEDDFIF